MADKIYEYGIGRNYLYLDGTSSLSPYIHFDMLGLRTSVDRAQQAILATPDELSCKSAETWLNELIWRKFFVHILYHYPHVRKGSFRTQYDRIQWRNDPGEFDTWKNGRSGYPVVHAAMRLMLSISIQYT